MITTTIALIALILSVSLGGYCIWLRNTRDVLQRKLSVVESTVTVQQTLLDTQKGVLEQLAKRLNTLEQEQKEELTQEQRDYRDKLQDQYSVLFQQIQDNMDADLKAARSETNDLVKKSRVEFDKKLKDEFEKACEQIKFNEIEYKKTITKKRKEYARKNGKNAKPQRVWRYIDEE